MMLKILCYVADKDAFEYITASESGRLATRTQNPFAQVPEIQDLERTLKARLEDYDPKPEGLSDLIAEVHQYNETVTTYERVRYVKTITPKLAHTIKMATGQCDARHAIRGKQNMSTVLDQGITVVKVERDGE
jgi:hypothetical protein